MGREEHRRRKWSEWEGQFLITGGERRDEASGGSEEIMSWNNIPTIHLVRLDWDGGREGGRESRGLWMPYLY